MCVHVCAALLLYSRPWLQKMTTEYGSAMDKDGRILGHHGRGWVDAAFAFTTPQPLPAAWPRSLPLSRCPFIQVTTLLSSIYIMPSTLVYNIVLDPRQSFHDYLI